MRAILAALGALALAACISVPKLPSFTHSAAPVAAAAPAKPVCPGGMTADLLPEPQLPPNAGFPAPATDPEGAAVAAYGAWLHSFAAWARQGWARASDAKAFCETH